MNLLISHQEGKAPKNISDHSHYLAPLEKSGLRGRSRIWADIHIEKQTIVIRLIVSILNSYGFKPTEIAYALSMVRVESGFNPDAAAHSSSATGLAQFIDATRVTLSKRVGLSHIDMYKFDATKNCILIAEHLIECFAWAKKQGENKWVAAYQYHHDGPFKDQGGAKIAKDKILPVMDEALLYVNTLLLKPILN